MNKLIPLFIHEKYKTGIKQGSFSAITMFMDISGFTRMTETLMNMGREGTEILSGILNEIFEPIINYVMNSSGFVSGFAGDAITIIFPLAMNNEDTVLKAYNTAIFINNMFQKHDFNSLKNLDFHLSVKIGLSCGNVEWGIIGNHGHNTYFFKGRAVDGCAKSEHHCEKADIIFDKEFYDFSTNILDIPINKTYTNHFLVNNEKASIIDVKNDHHNNACPELSAEVLKQFFNENVIHFQSIGEFRNIVSVFISIKEFDDFSASDKIISSIIEKADMFGGYFNSLDFGDKGCNTLILFGAPVSYENETMRALNFILEILNKHPGSVRAGISSGVAYTGIVGSNKRCCYTALGDVVNMSARYMMKADWGDVWTSERIYKSADDVFEFESLGKLEFKGKSGTIPAYSLKNRKASSNSGSFLKGRLIGRESEISLLEKYTATTFNDSKGGIVYLYGNAGIGKSKLLNHYLDKYKDDAYIFILQSDDILKKSLNPFVSFFENEFGLTGIRSLKDRKNTFDIKYNELCDKLQSLMNSNDSKDIIDELRREKTIIGALLDLHWEGSIYEKISIEDRPTVTATAVKEFLKTFLQNKPVILVLENIHCIDFDSVELIQSLLNLCNHYPFTVIASGRYYDDGTAPKLEINNDSILCNTIELKPLQPKHTGDFVKDKLGYQADNKLISLINVKTEGNPFFMEQLCIYLVENKSIELINNKYVLKNTNIDIPLEINSMLISRIDRLSGRLKALIQFASVIGKNFDSQLINDALSENNIYQDSNTEYKKYYKTLSNRIGKDELGNILSNGVQEQIWYRFASSQYIFMNALLVSSAYNMQLKKMLRFYHFMIASIIENIYNNDKTYYADIAYHYDNANQYSKAFDYFNKAGLYSKESYKNEKALEYFNKALRIYDNMTHKNLDAVIDLYGNIGEAYQNICDFDKSLEFFNKVLDIINTTKDIADKHKADTYHSISTVYLFMGEVDKALDNSYKAMDIQIKIFGKDSTETAHTYNNIAMIHNSKSEYDTALEYLNKSHDIFKLKYGIKHEDTALTYANIGMVYWFKGDYDKTLYYTTKSADIYTELFGEKHPKTANLYNNLGMVYWNKSEYEKAIKYLSKCKDIISELFGKSHPNSSMINNNLGLVYVEIGDYDLGLTNLYHALTVNKETYGEKHLSTAFSYTNIGKAFYSKGEYQKAVEYLNKSYEIRKSINDKSNIGYDLIYLSLCHAYSGNIKNALDYALLHLKNIKEIGVDIEHGKTYLSIAIALSKTDIMEANIKKLIGEIEAVTNHKPEAEAYFRKAIQRAEQTNYYHTLIPALYEFGKYLCGIGNNDEGKKYILDAIKTAREKGLEKISEQMTHTNELKEEN